jgi:hypothetical protein
VPSVLPLYDRGPVTFEANATIVGGQLVEPDAATGRIKPAASGSTIVLGVATSDAVPTSVSQVPTIPGVTVAINASPLSQYVAVAGEGVWQLTTTLAVLFGARVKVGTVAGTVSPWISGTDASNLIVAVCYEPAGVGAAGTGAFKLTLV